jgi:hypothetical protein
MILANSYTGAVTSKLLAFVWITSLFNRFLLVRLDP